ncbi:apolipoprotein C-IV isoform X1 [Chlorocebus sabaeus]|uniref:Apolipoprotein C-IV n=1 Tax=Chlorocebus sabaeus TaxID=60711 RepID=APOC4_CHLSB|nr:apolipoprotein C-IV isoform X2 [Chlorocebus sabaeus]A0A0D9S1R4.1 RecName: Full=Apolipoprotein C-IV; Short=Apo-CIV; Short=ApoC-IV; AltName: Full=Apolipoprotein C4; Flags: Precursor [Chlorocebus sabaeus]
MSLLRNRLQDLPALCLCVLVLACIGACQSEAYEGTPSPPPKLKMSHWSLVTGRMKELLEPVVNRTRDRWQWFWSPSTFRGFMQTYYDDHLRDLGPRTKAWLLKSKESLLNKTHSLCPRIVCGDKDQG